MLVGTALDELARTDRQTALILMCVGGGQGIATILSRVRPLRSARRKKKRSRSS
jgi:threonine dehydratase